MTQATRAREVLEAAFDAFLGKKRFIEVFEVESYTAAEGKTPVADLIAISKGRTNSGAEVERVRLVDVPVPPLAFGDFLIHAPLVKGNRVIVVFAGRSLDDYLENGAVGPAPTDPRRFDVHDAIAMYRLDPIEAGIGADTTGDKLTIATRTGNGAITLDTSGNVVVDSPSIKLGGAGVSQAVALAPAVRAELNSLWSAIRAHVHPFVGLAPGAAGSTAVSPFPGTAGNVGANKVTAE